MNNSNKNNERILGMTFDSVYPHYLVKVEKKGGTKLQLHHVIEWPTGYNEKQLLELIEEKGIFEQFFNMLKKTQILTL